MIQNGGVVGDDVGVVVGSQFNSLKVLLVSSEEHLGSDVVEEATLGLDGPYDLGQVLEVEAEGQLFVLLD